jgi:Zn-dependent protease with chaperone function
MFTNIIYFMLVLFIFHTGTAERLSAHSLWLSCGGILLIGAFFGFEARRRFKALERQAQSPGADHYRAQRRYQQVQQQFMIFSLLFFGAEVYFLNLKSLILLVPGTGQFSSWEGLLGISVYWVHLSMIWYYGFPVNRALFHTAQSQGAYVWSQFQFNLPILFPWILVTALTDVLEKVGGAKVKALLDHPLGEISYILVFLIFLSLFLPYLIKVWWHCRPLPEGPKKEEVNRFCRELGSPFQELLLWPVFEGQMLTAGVMGLVKRFRYLLITPSLLQLLDLEELKGVVAHEIGHIRKKHMLFYLLFFAGYALLALLFYQLVSQHLLTQPEILKLLYRWQTHSEGLLSLLSMAPLAIFLVLYFRFLFGFFMRNFERQADLYAMQLLRSPAPIVNSLEKIGFYSGQDRHLPSWHHYSIAQRVEFLEKSSREPQIIERHQKKVSWSVGFYLILLIGLGAAAWRAPGIFTPGGQGEAQILEKLLTRELRARPDDPRILSGLGLIYQQQKRYGEAETAYKKVLVRDPRNALVLNNLAWMYATSPDPQFFRPKEALGLAQMAATFKPDPVIWDTLAEAYLVNDRPDLSLRIMEEILAGNPDNREYFEGQRERFKKAWEKTKSEKVNPNVPI